MGGPEKGLFFTEMLNKRISWWVKATISPKTFAILLLQCIINISDSFPSKHQLSNYKRKEYHSIIRKSLECHSNHISFSSILYYFMWRLKPKNYTVGCLGQFTWTTNCSTSNSSGNTACRYISACCHGNSAHGYRKIITPSLPVCTTITMHISHAKCIHTQHINTQIHALSVLTVSVWIYFFGYIQPLVT